MQCRVVHSDGNPINDAASSGSAVFSKKSPAATYSPSPAGLAKASPLFLLQGQFLVARWAS